MPNLFGLVKTTVAVAAVFAVLLIALMVGALYVYASSTSQASASALPQGGAYFPAVNALSPGSPSPTVATTSAGPNGPYPKVVSVVIQSGAVTDQSESSFSPSVVTLVVGVNNTITFTNEDNAVHTVASFSVPPGATQFSSGTLKVGASYTITFSARGTYAYACVESPWVNGVVIVK